MEEVKTALRTSKNTAPGPDGVTYKDIEQLTDMDLVAITKIFNNSIQTSTIPEDWLHSYLIPFPKPNKNCCQINGYRIIALQNTIGKLIEKIISRKMLCTLERLNCFPPTLGGYRPNRATWVNAGVFAYDVYEGFHSREETCAVAIDLEDAYNRVSFGYLIHILSGMEIAIHHTAWIAEALCQRKVAMRCGEWNSDPMTICPGLPQGSPLSPILFNIYTMAITANQLDGRGRTLSYADDVLVYRQGTDRNLICQALQEELDRLTLWCNESKARVNPVKATVTWFSLNNNITTADVPVMQLEGEAISRTNTLTYLGVKFDRTLCFRSHIDQVITKSRRGLAAMKVMASANIEQRLLFLLYQGLVLAPIEYAAAIFTASDTQINRLEKVQNEAMRIILGCTRDTPCVAMRHLLNFPTMKCRLEIWKAQAFHKIRTNPDHPLHKELEGKKRGDRLKRGKSWIGRAEDISKRICKPSDITLGAEWIRTPMWLNEKIQCITTLNKKMQPSEINTEVLSIIDENTNENDVVIYTDGSVQRHRQSAWAYTASMGGKTVKEESGAYAMTASSLTMEVMAVTRALKWSESYPYTGLCIVSDSLNMINKIQNGFIRRQWMESLSKSNTCKVIFIYVPGHTGVRGNERADKLAGNAHLLEGRPMDSSDIINNLVENGCINDLNQNISPSIDRLQELGIKRGTARTETFSGHSRRIVNQYRTGTLSRTTLSEILRGESERLWTCPMCYDDDPLQ